MKRRDADVVAVAALAIVAACGIFVLPAGVPRFLCATVLLLLAPGYAVSTALFPFGAITTAVRLMVGCLLALSMLAVGAVVLDVTTIGLSRESWSMLFLVLTLGACGMTIDRRGDAPHAPVRVALPRLRPPDVALLVVAAFAVTAGVVISRTPLPAKKVLGYTQLWMVPVDAAGDNVFRVGIRSAERISHTYKLELEVGGVTRVLHANIVLAPGARFEQQVRLQDTLPPATGAFDMRTPGLLAERPDPPEERVAMPDAPLDATVTARLYRLDIASVAYRRVTARLR